MGKNKNIKRKDYKKFITPPIKPGNLDLMIDEQMGNYIRFHSYRYQDPPLSPLWDAASNCKKHGIFTDVGIDEVETLVVILKNEAHVIATDEEGSHQE